MLVRVIPNDDEARIPTLKLIRAWSNLPLADAKVVMDKGLEFNLSQYLRGEDGDFFLEAKAANATVVIGRLPVPSLPLYDNIESDGPPVVTLADVLKEVKAMRREQASLRKHLGMMAHE